MLRLREPQESMWDYLLPLQAQTLSDELAIVDAWLSDDRFFGPYWQRFNTRLGRPTVPVETYLRLMYLKYRYGFGYETLVREVADSLHWRRFCHIPLDAAVPHPTTLSKLTRKYGPAVLQELNALLMQQAREQDPARTEAAGGHHGGPGTHRTSYGHRAAGGCGPRGNTHGETDAGRGRGCPHEVPESPALRPWGPAGRRSGLAHADGRSENGGRTADGAGAARHPPGRQAGPPGAGQ